MCRADVGVTVMLSVRHRNLSSAAMGISRYVVQIVDTADVKRQLKSVVLLKRERTVGMDYPWQVHHTTLVHITVAEHFVRLIA